MGLLDRLLGRTKKEETAPPADERPAAYEPPPAQAESTAEQPSEAEGGETTPPA